MADVGCSTRKVSSFYYPIENSESTKKYSCLATARRILQAQSGLTNQSLLSTGTYSSKMNNDRTSGKSMEGEGWDIELGTVVLVGKEVTGCNLCRIFCC